jgi:molybdopterin converting factor small subunit
MTALQGSSIRVRLLLFASYADLIGRESADLVVQSPATVGDVVHAARAALPQGGRLPERPLAAVNLRHTRLDHPVLDGDEVALLPPMAGG